MPRFYDTPAWKAARRAALIRDSYRCVVCGRDISGKGQTRVDHIKPLATHPHLALTLANLRSLCPTHDNQTRTSRGAVFTISGCDSAGRPLDPGHHWAAQ
jgi:5-methylcytosine-specific restriction protein A